MELPKNITQIGEVDKTCKVYVEDYVVSYMKELNKQAEDKEVSVALYGRYEPENGVDYHFIYGACKVEQLPKEVRHLSQAQQQEIERFRKQYFPELTFIGYRLLNGEMIEGFYIRDRDVCRYIAGYAQFYEKNDAMLAYMLDVRETVQPELVDQEKYERVRKRQEERKSVAESAEENGRHTASDPEHGILGFPFSHNLQRMRLGAIAVFAVLCLFGIATFKENPAPVPEQGNLVAVNAPVSESKDKLMIEDKLEEALLAENRTEMSQTQESESLPVSDLTEESQETAASQEVPESQAVSEPQEATQPQEETQPQGAAETQPAAASQEASVVPEIPAAEPANADTAVQEAVAYVIQPGDTLIAISRRQYGTDAKVQAICERNKITDPNNIKQGQVLMLPR